MFFSRAFDSSCISIAGVDTEELDENYISLDQVDIGTRQVGGVNPAPVDLDINGVVMDRHFDHVALRFGVRVGEFRFFRTDEEVERGSLERDRFQGIERAIMNVYDYIRGNFPLDDRVQVDVESNDFTLGGVTTALVRVA